MLTSAVVKLFPASLGGPAYLKALRDPFPGIPFVAVGGVGLADVPRYLDAGAVAVGVGGPLVGDAASGGDPDALRNRARAFLAATSPPPRKAATCRSSQRTSSSPAPTATSSP